eukprot:TRINITY_DN47192_c0_g1_i1.p1 TRINITY_DN47192_c0_g1~~TRINITY_DN47192_c0_g1_i1.p1  ORF type:complete len:400 (+),score=91.81 TRINITY_DN47192_c0_g1_i1:58-1257(+)
MGSPNNSRQWGYPWYVDLPLPAMTRADKRRAREAESVVSKGSLDEVRRLCCEGGGLVTAAVRRMAWPRLLGIQHSDIRRIEAEYPHPDRGQIELDVNRSMFMIPDSHRQEFRQRLLRVLLAALTDHGRLDESKPVRWYYQGFHDVATIFILVLGEECAAAALSRVAEWQLRPWMVKGSRFRDVVDLVPAVLEAGNIDLFQCLDRTVGQAGMGADYTLSWVLTWFSHRLDRLDHACRVFDFLLASPPITVVYLAAACVLSRHDEIVSVEDFCSHWEVLQRMPRDPDLEQWFRTARELAEKMPPANLVSRVYGGEAPRAVHPEVSSLFVHPRDPRRAGEVLAERLSLYPDSASVPLRADPPRRSGWAASDVGKLLGIACAALIALRVLRTFSAEQPLVLPF